MRNISCQSQSPQKQKQKELTLNELHVSTAQFSERAADCLAAPCATNGKTDKDKMCSGNVVLYIVPLQWIPCIGVKQGPSIRRASPGLFTVLEATKHLQRVETPQQTCGVSSFVGVRFRPVLQAF